MSPEFVKDAETALKRHTIYEDNCWIFIGTNNSHGYGQIRVWKKLYSVHRLSAELYLNLDTSNTNINVCHKDDVCKYKACWNPKHLYIGTQKDNIRDSIISGTFTGPYKSAEKRRLAQLCNRGHEFTPENTYVTPQGKRRCRECRKLRGN